MFHVNIDFPSNLLTATRSCFRYTGMDYVYQISMLQVEAILVIKPSFKHGFFSFKVNKLYGFFSGNPDYNRFHMKKRKKHVVLDSISSFMAGYSTFFRQVKLLLNVESLFLQLHISGNKCLHRYRPIPQPVEQEHSGMFCSFPVLVAFPFLITRGKKTTGQPISVWIYNFKLYKSGFFPE